MKKPDRYAVMGNPIAHSKSPAIHTRFAEQTGEAVEYSAILVEQGDFPAAVERFRSEGGRGLNVTVPFKQEAWELAQRRSERAELAGAVNTLKFEDDGAIFGDNTDGLGITRDITVNHGVSLQGKRLLILGAGGAVRGVLQPLLAQGTAQLVIANRTPSRAEELAQLFADHGSVRGCGFEALNDEAPFDAVINGTAASLQGELPPLPDHLLAEDALCYDMMYGAEPTPFMQWAGAHGAGKVLDGLGMLVEQAAESFAIWRGVRPDSAAVIKMIRASLG